MIKCNHFFILILLTISTIFLLIGCGGGGSSSSSATSNQVEDFNKDKSLAALRSSILIIPENIQLTGDAASGKKSKSNLHKHYKSLAYDGLWSNNYAAITDTINFSDLVKKNVISFLDYVFDCYVLSSS